MTFDQLEAKIMSILPDAILEESADGELVIFTSLHETLDGELVPFTG